MSIPSRTPSLTPSRSSSPEPPVQPDHFYGNDHIDLTSSPGSNGKLWLDPADDPLAHRGIPVFKPSMEEFQDFEAYVSKIECWGSRSGIVKIIPPQQWKDALPPISDLLPGVKIKSPIEQHMLGRGGLFRQENVEKRRLMSIREWTELCSKEDYQAPSIDNFQARGAVNTKRSIQQKRGAKADGIQIKLESTEDDSAIEESALSLVASANRGSSLVSLSTKLEDDSKPKKQSKEANLAERANKDQEFLRTFDPHTKWLPANTKPSDYTPDFCQKLERFYWRTCGFGRPAWYGADCAGSLFTDDVKSWNIAHLPSALSRLLPQSAQGLPGVNTPYLYFGMWRATFAWHVEDMDLFSINYIHFGAPKFWYSVPQARANAFEQTMRGYFPGDTSQCDQFLRHKSFLASSTLLSQSSCRPNNLVQHAQEIVITFPRGYHAGFNLGLNCAESVNFALESWIELGLKAKACNCITDSVRIDVQQLLADRTHEDEEREEVNDDGTFSVATVPESIADAQIAKNHRHSSTSRKRKAHTLHDLQTRKKIKLQPPMTPTELNTDSPAQPRPKITLTLKLGPRPSEPEAFPCCLCVSMSKDDLLPVHDPPLNRKDACEAAGNPKKWMAHRRCADIVPETWVDEIEEQSIASDGRLVINKVIVVFGVDGIVKDRWNLKCATCSKSKPKTHGAPIQCTKGKCSKAFHISCAQEGSEQGVLFAVVREVEKEVVLLNPPPAMNLDTLADGLGLPPSSTENQDSDVLKIIKKLEVQVLCNQHNPAVAAAKKASKQDKIRSQLLALPAMARIKIRVSAGVFEVSLVRVMEETGSIEVLWDRGIKREFKWGSVVFGSTDCPVQQKPTELGVEPAPEPIGIAVNTFPSIAAAVGTSIGASSSDQTRTLSHHTNTWLKCSSPHPGFANYPYGPSDVYHSRTQHPVQYHLYTASPTPVGLYHYPPPYQPVSSHPLNDPGNYLSQPPHAASPGASSSDSDVLGDNPAPNMSSTPSTMQSIDWVKLASIPPEEITAYLRDNPNVGEAVLSSLEKETTQIRSAVSS